MAKAKSKAMESKKSSSAAKVTKPKKAAVKSASAKMVAPSKSAAPAKSVTTEKPTAAAKATSPIKSTGDVAKQASSAKAASAKAAPANKPSTLKKSPETAATPASAAGGMGSAAKVSMKGVQKVQVEKPVKKTRAAKKLEETNEKITQLGQKWSALFRKSQDLEAAAYNMRQTYEAKTAIMHKVLGWGYIMANKNDRLEVLFKDGIRYLISNYKA